MDELELFRDFRRGVAAPSGDAQRRASARLASAVDREQPPRTSVLRLIEKRRGRSALALVAVAGATATAVFLSTPWNNSPGFLERAQAALTPDAETVLHAKWEETWTSTDPQCTVERGPNEIWIDQTPPHRLRAVLEHPSGPAADPRALVCSSGTRSELRGSAPYGWKLSALFPGDPVKALREAISAGRAHDEGETQLAGRTVRRIRVDPERLYTYVDPDSFYPVAEHGFMGVGNGQVMARFRVVRRYLTFEYLPRTAANLALTDIRAQHPNATGP